MDIVAFVYGLDLKNHFIFADDVDSVSFIDLQSVVLNRLLLLANHFNVLQNEFMIKAHFIGVLRKPVTKFTVRLDSCSNYLIAQLTHFCALSVLCG